MTEIIEKGDRLIVDSNNHILWWYTPDGRKWCACGDGIDADESQCETCAFLNEMESRER